MCFRVFGFDARFACPSLQPPHATPLMCGFYFWNNGAPGRRFFVCSYLFFCLTVFYLFGLHLAVHVSCGSPFGSSLGEAQFLRIMLCAGPLCLNFCLVQLMFDFVSCI